MCNSISDPRRLDSIWLPGNGTQRRISLGRFSAWSRGNGFMFSLIFFRFLSGFGTFVALIMFFLCLIVCGCVCVLVFGCLKLLLLLLLTVLIGAIGQHLKARHVHSIPKANIRKRGEVGRNVTRPEGKSEGGKEVGRLPLLPTHTRPHLIQPHLLLSLPQVLRSVHMLPPARPTHDATLLTEGATCVL